VSKPETDGFLAVFMFKELPQSEDPNHELLLNSFYRKEQLVHKDVYYADE
jgi:hypothetical protein